MILNTNLPALNALRHLGNTSESQSKTLRKLSSGMRINMAGDDAAGLGISEKMRGQIRGMDMAARNAKEGISLIQTAEGAFDSIHNITQRIRELAVQAASDTLTNNDRAKIQLEIDSLIEEIDHTAKNTEFNTIKLLDGSLAGISVDPAVQAAMLDYLNGSWLENAINVIEARTGLTFDNNIILDVKFADLGLGTVATMGSSSNNINYTLTLNTRYLSGLTIADFSTASGPLAGGILLDRLITHEMTHALMRHNVNMNPPMWFTEGLAEAVHGASDIRFGDFSNQYIQSYAQSLMGSFTATTGGSEAYTSGYLAVMYLDNLGANGVAGGALPGGGMVDTLLSNMEIMPTFDDAILATYGKNLNDIVNQMKNDAAANINSFLANCNIGQDSLADALENNHANGDNIVPNIPSGSIPIDPSLVDTKPLNGGWAMTVNWPGIAAAVGDFFLHIGANYNQEISLKIPAMNSAAIFGQYGINLGTQSSANDALGIIDDPDLGVNYISSARTDLGAVQNRLEFTIDNLNISNENISSAESRIRDVNMAREMINMTKFNVLNQSVTAMLAQANQRPQSVLSLLQ